MGYSDTWKLLEDMMIELRRKGVAIPQNVLTDLKSAKLMINISKAEGSRGDATRKVEEYLTNVEGYLVFEVEKAFGSERVDAWLRKLDSVSCETCATQPEKKTEDTFISGVPRDQKWIRVEPIKTLPEERLEKMAKDLNLQVNPQKDGRLVIFGQPDEIKQFLKKMTLEAAKK